VGKKWLFWFCEGLALCVRAKPNVPLVRLAKIELKNMCGWENKKYRRVGNECRLSCCPFEIWSVCRWSPVKISVSFMFKVVRLFVVVSSVRLACNEYVYAIYFYSCVDISIVFVEII
jgi:hypothetical protein